MKWRFKHIHIPGKQHPTTQHSDPHQNDLDEEKESKDDRAFRHHIPNGRSNRCIGQMELSANTGKHGKDFRQP